MVMGAVTRGCLLEGPLRPVSSSRCIPRSLPSRQQRDVAAGAQLSMRALRLPLRLLRRRRRAGQGARQTCSGVGLVGAAGQGRRREVLGQGAWASQLHPPAKGTGLLRPCLVVLVVGQALAVGPAPAGHRALHPQWGGQGQGKAGRSRQRLLRLLLPQHCQTCSPWTPPLLPRQPHLVQQQLQQVAWGAWTS